MSVLQGIYRRIVRSDGSAVASESSLRGGASMGPSISWTAQVANGSTETAAEVSGPCVLHGLVVGAANQHVRVEVAFKTHTGGTLSRAAMRDNLSTTTSPELRHIALGGHPILRAARWDEDAGQFVVSLPHPITLPFGFRVRVANSTGAPVTCTLVASFSELEQ